MKGSRGFAIGLFAAGLALFACTVTLYVESDAVARYAWRHWRAPALAIALDRGDAPLALEIGGYYFGTTVIGRQTPVYEPGLAKRAFERAVAIDPSILWGHYELARIAFAAGDFATALAEADAELKANPENLRTLYVRGLVYGYRGLPGDLSAAESDFTRFVAWAPAEWAGYNDLAWILEKEGEYGQVEGLMKSAFANVPGGTKNPWLWNELGVARLNLGELALAHTAFTNALTYAKALTPEEWRAAYTGDSPSADQAGLAAFIAGIEANLAKTGG